MTTYLSVYHKLFFNRGCSFEEYLVLALSYFRYNSLLLTDEYLHHTVLDCKGIDQPRPTCAGVLLWFVHYCGSWSVNNVISGWPWTTNCINLEVTDDLHNIILTPQSATNVMDQLSNLLMDGFTVIGELHFSGEYEPLVKGTTSIHFKNYHLYCSIAASIY